MCSDFDDLMIFPHVFKFSVDNIYTYDMFAPDLVMVWYEKLKTWGTFLWQHTPVPTIHMIYYGTTLIPISISFEMYDTQKNAILRHVIIMNIELSHDIRRG